MEEEQGQKKKFSKPFDAIGSLRQNIRVVPIITLIGSILAIIAGIKLPKPFYEVEALLLLEPYLPKILYSADKSAFLHSYEDWMRTQVKVITSYPILKESIELYHQQGYVWRKPDESLKTAMDRLGAKLKVKQQLETQIVTINMSSSKKEGLAEIINSTIDVYINSKIQERQSEDNFKLEYLQSEKKKNEALLDSSYRKLEELSSKFNVAIAEEKSRSVFTQSLLDLKEAYNALVIEEIKLESQAEALYEELKFIDQEDFRLQAEAAVEENPIFKDNKLQLSRKEQEIRNQMIGLKKDNPDYQHYQAFIDDINRRVESMRVETIEKEIKKLKLTRRTTALFEIRTIENSIERILREKQKLQQILDETQKQALEFNTAVLRTNTQTQEIERFQAVLNKINERIQEIRIESITPGRVFVISKALPPDGPAPSKAPLIMIAGIIGSAILGCLVAIMKGFFDDTVLRPSDILKVLGFPVTDYILNSTFDLIPPADVYTIYKNQPRSYLFEQFRRIALHFEKEHREFKSQVYVTMSPKDSSGVTSFIINVLAFLDSPRDKKILVDLNQRNPISNVISGVPRTQNFLENMKSTEDISRFVLKDLDLPFHVLSLGSDGISIDHSEIEEVIQELRKHYTYIYVDSPPLLLSADSQKYSLIGDVVIMMVMGSQTLWHELLRSLDILDHLKIQAISIVLNNTGLLKSGYLRKEIKTFYSRELLKEYSTQDLFPFDYTMYFGIQHEESKKNEDENKDDDLDDDLNLGSFNG